MRLLSPLFVFRSIRGFFPPLTWDEEVLEYDSSAECTNDHLPKITMVDWVELFTPEVEIPLISVDIKKNPTCIFQGLPLKASMTAFKAFLAFRKIDIPGIKT